jgi:hypothetical protein
VFQKVARDKGLVYAIKDFVEFLNSVKKNSVERTSIHYQLLYLPYATVLVELSHAVGDPCKAFQISTEKPPTSWRHIFVARSYYKDEFSRQ